MKTTEKRPLFVYEMANNHMGDVAHIRIRGIEEALLLTPMVGQAV